MIRMIELTAFSGRITSFDRLAAQAGIIHQVFADISARKTRCCEMLVTFHRIM